MSRKQDVELDFFTADDVGTRADAFSELDPNRNRENLIYPLTGVIAVVMICVVAFAFPPTQGPGKSKKATASKRVKSEGRPVAVAPPPPPPAASSSPAATTESGEAAKADRPARRRMMRRPPPPPLPAALAAMPVLPVASPLPVAEPEPAAEPEPVAEPESEVAVAEPAAPTPWLRRTLKKSRAPAQPAPEVEEAVAAAQPEPESEAEPASAPEPLPTRPTLAKAQQLIVAGRNDEALEILEPLERDSAVLAMLGRSYYEIGRDRDALGALLKARKAGEAGVHTLLLLGDLLQNRDTGGSREAYQAFLTHHPRSPHATEVAAILRTM